MYPMCKPSLAMARLRKYTMSVMIMSNDVMLICLFSNTGSLLLIFCVQLCLLCWNYA